MSTAQNPGSAPSSQFAETLVDLLDRVEYRRVQPADLSDPVYRLRYEAYRREGFIPFNGQEALRDEFDDLPNAHCFGIHIDGQLVSSLRIHHLTPAQRTSPSYSVFQNVLDPLLDQGASCVDPGRFTTDFEASLAYPALPFLTLRLAVLATKYFGSKYGLHSVRPEHAAFYRRVFSSTLMAEARYYHGLSFPMELWGCDAPAVYPKTVRRYPFFMSTAEERQKLFAPGDDGAIPAIQPTARMAQKLAALQNELV